MLIFKVLIQILSFLILVNSQEGSSSQDVITVLLHQCTINNKLLSTPVQLTGAIVLGLSCKVCDIISLQPKIVYIGIKINPLVYNAN
jgi:hypothetical protein